MSQKIMTPEELEKKYPTEEVFAVKKEIFGVIEDGIHKTSPEVNQLVAMLLQQGYFVPRKYAEYNPEHLQLIPYVVIKHKDLYFGAKRIGGDVRIIGKTTIGMGGHINPEDQEGEENVFHNCMIRELSSEELHIDLTKTTSLTLKGIIRYTSPEDLLSQDHLGLLYVLETDDENVTIKETDSLEGRFFTVEELIAGKEKSESWSRMIIEILEKEGTV